MIESIYIDVAGEPRPRYIQLVEKLAAAEDARLIHEQMNARVLKLHDERIKRTRAELENERLRLEKIIRGARA